MPTNGRGGGGGLVPGTGDLTLRASATRVTTNDDKGRSRTYLEGGERTARGRKIRWTKRTKKENVFRRGREARERTTDRGMIKSLRNDGRGKRPEGRLRTWMDGRRMPERVAREIRLTGRQRKKSRRFGSDEKQNFVLQVFVRD